MQDEQLARIEAKIDGLATSQLELRQEMRALNEETRQEMHALHQEGRREMHTLFEQARHEARVLHEEALDRISALAPDFAPIRREFKQADTALRESLEPRIEALEAAERARRRKP
jgi:hypothetical protein